MRTGRWIGIATVCGWSIAGCGGAPDDGGAAVPVGTQQAPLISGADDLTEGYYVTEPVSRLLSSGVPAQWLAKELTDLGNGDSAITRTPYTINDTGLPLCTNVRFYGQQMGDGLACTGFLVAPDLVATAGHCLTEWGWTWSDWRYVFGYYSRRTDGPGVEAPTAFNNKKIYKPVALVANGAAGLTGAGQDDWALVRLDRPATGSIFPVDPHAYQPNDHFVPLWSDMGSWGYGRKLTLKYDVTNSPGVAWNSFGFLVPLDTFPGASGSPVFDLQSHVVRGLVAGTFTDDYVADGTCYRPNVVPSGGGVANYTEATFTDGLAAYLRPTGTRIDAESVLSTGPLAAISGTADHRDYLFTVGADATAYVKTRPSPGGGAWSSWSAIIGTASLATDGITATQGMNELLIFARGTDGLIYYNILNEVTRQWLGWTSSTLPSGFLAATPPGSFLIDQPATRPLVVLSAVDTVGNLWTQYVTYAANADGSYTRSGPGNWSYSGGAASVYTGAQIPGKTVAILSYLRGNQVVYEQVNNQPGTPLGGVGWGGIQNMTTPSPMISLQPYVHSDGTFTLVGRDTKDQLWTISSNGRATINGAGAITNLGTWTSRGTALFDRPTLTNDRTLYSLGPDRHVYSKPLTP